MDIFILWALHNSHCNEVTVIGTNNVKFYLVHIKKNNFLLFSLESS